MPSFGTLFAPSSALLSNSAHRLELHQGLAFGLANLAWAIGQTIAAPPAARSPRPPTTSCHTLYSPFACLATFLLLRTDAASSWRTA